MDDLCMIMALEEFFNSSERIFQDLYKNISGGSTEFDQKRKQKVLFWIRPSGNH